MLAPEDRERIRSEEMYRDEVRRQLDDVHDAAPSKTARMLQNIWSVLNSQVGGWLLSTVLLGSVAWGYSEWWLPRQEEKAAKQSVLSEVQFRLDLADRMSNRDAAIQLINGVNALNPDHEGRDMAALLWQLGSLNGNLETLRPYGLYFRRHGNVAPVDFSQELKNLRQEIGQLTQN